MRIVLTLLLAAPLVAATVPLSCTGSAILGTFRVSVRPFSPGPPLPLKSVSAIPAGSRLIWSPIRLPPHASGSGEVTAVLVTAPAGDLVTLEPRKAAARAEWQLLDRPQVIALIYGPQGLSEGKIKSLVTRNRDLVRQLADYADQSSQVESLVQELADAQQSGGGADAILRGFSAQYGLTPQKLDTKAPTDQQAALLLKALLPAASAYDPLANRTSQVQQSGGLAASVAGMFFGNPVGLAVGGAALLQNLKTVLFPDTEFRSAFAQTAGTDGMAFCTKNLAPKSKTRTAYLWAYRVPEAKKPTLALAGPAHLPIGSKSTLALEHGTVLRATVLDRARDWRLTPVSGGPSIPVEVRAASTDSLEIHPAANTPAGDYHLGATWDWESLPVSGTLHLYPYGDVSKAVLARGEADKLVEGSGKVAVELAGADFQFVESASLETPGQDAKPRDIRFSLPVGKRAGPQRSLTVNIDTAREGSYRLVLTQSDGVAHRIPLIILPPNPELSNLPIRLNMGETIQDIRLLGSGLDRIDAASSDAGEITGAPAGQRWRGRIQLKEGVVKDQRFGLLLKVKGLENPLTVPDAIEIVGPRPKILSVRKSLAETPAIAIAADELPAGTAAGLVLRVQASHDAIRPRLELGCESGSLRKALTLSPNEPTSGASLSFAGPGVLYLSVDPGSVGYAGCRLTATVIHEPEGRSDRFLLGRVIRVPHLDKFTLTNEKAGDSSYAGIIEGTDLDVIEKTGWDAVQGVAVESIPTPVAGDPARQTVRVVLPWPAPGPHAPLYVWLRGETQGRKTSVAY
ncbi:MAG: hypothetical protein IT166_21425 [Bryobacterales bacterium]|nr:hypothetical protein [Bryobacterales bacterium]